MVKDGWSQAASSNIEASSNSMAIQEPIQANTVLKNSLVDSPIPGNNINGLSTGNGPATNNTTSAGGVWGVYESREKLIDMHIC